MLKKSDRFGFAPPATSFMRNSSKSHEAHPPMSGVLESRSLYHFKSKSFQVLGFRNSRENRVIGALRKECYSSQLPP